MPRYIVNESDDDYEPKTAPTRKTRAAVAAATVTDSPIRRSTRNRQSPVNPDGSSPESITGTLPTLSTRITRRRVAAAAANTLPVSEPARALRSRKNSVSSNVSENPENESTPGTPRTRAIKRLSIVELSPGPLKPGSKIRGNTRASSESKSPPPVVRTTRRTRASSIDPEPSVERATRGSAVALAQSTPISTPTRKRRQQVSVHPTEPALAEEENDDKIHESSKIDIVDGVPEEEIEDEIILDKTSLESSRRSSSSSSGKKSPKNKSLKKYTDVEDEVDENLTEELTEKVSTTEILSIKDKFQIEEQEEAELLKTPECQEQVEVISAANIEAKNSPKSVEILAIKTKRHLLDKSKELGMKIEDLLNKSTEEQEKSPGNKENEKLNVSPEKVKKNLEFTVSIVDIAKSKSLSSTRFLNKSTEKKINILDKQVLSEPRFDIAAAISAEIRGNKSVNTSKDSHDLSVEKKSQSESPNVVNSVKKNRNEEAIETESGGDHSSSKTSYTKINETSVENEVIEELTLDDSESEFSLAVEDDVESEKKTIDQSSNKRSSLNKSEKTKSNENSDGGSESDSNSDIFVLSNVSKNSSRKNSINDVESKKQDTPKRRISLKSKKAEELLEVSKSDDKQDKKRQSIEKIENEETEVTKKDFVIENDSKKDINEEEAMDTNEHEEEAMDTNEHEEAKTNDNCNTVSAEKNSLDKKEEHLKEDKQSKSESKNEVLESDSEIAIDNLFQNISAEEWNKKKKNDSPKLIENKRKSSLKGRIQMNTETNSEDDLVLASEKSWKKEDSDSGDTLILKKNDSPKKINKNKKPGAKPTLEDGDNEDEEMEVTVDSKKSPNKSVGSNTSMKNESNDQIEGEDNKKNSGITIQEEEEEKPEIDDDISEAETIPSNIDKITPLKSNENIEEEKEPVSSKNTSKNSIYKTKKKSSDVYRFEDSFEDEDSNDESANESTDNEENTEFLNSISKLESRKRLNLSDKKSRTPLDRNYSTVAVADSESDNATRAMPGYLFSVGSSDDDDYNAEEEGDQSKCSMDSDIAKEMNLAGDDDLEYSDDNVTADDCHASESEHSDEDDAGSDIDGFIIADDEVESSEYSEEETSPKGKFKRILDKSSSEEEDNNEEADEKLKHNSLCKTPDDQDSQSSKNESAIKLTKLQRKQLNFSIESDKTFSDKKIKKGINVPENSVSPSVEKVEKKEDKNVKKIYKPLRSLMNTTIDLCTPETNPKTQITDENVRQSPGLNTSLSKKLRKNLVVDLGTSTPEKSNEMHKDEEEEEESVFIPQTKTPNKDKKTPNKEIKTPNKERKTPKSASKNPRDSMQLIEDTALLKSSISDLNKSMVTPNSESPVTKFLKKERLNESLPLLELKKRASKTFETKTLNKMSEDEQEEDDADETDEQEKAAEESGDEESDANDNSEEKGDEINARGHQDDDEEDETDKEEDDEDLDKQNDLELEDEESEEPSDDEKTKKRKKEKRKSASKIVKTPEIKGIEKSRKSGGRKSQSKSEEDEQEADDAVEIAKQKEATKESEEEESDTNDILEEKADEINANGHQDDDDDEEEDDDETDKEEDNEDLDDENDWKPKDEESKESSDEELEDEPKKEKSKSTGKAVKTPEIKGVEKSKKSGGRKSTSELEKDLLTKVGTDITPNKDLIKRRSRTSTSSIVNEKSADSNKESISQTKKRHLSTPGTELPTRKKRARLESSETPLGPKDGKKVKAYAVLEDNETEGENDEAPESIGFGQARTEALKEMKDVASSLKAAKEAKKKKRKDQLERIRVEKEAKISKKLSQEVKTSPESVNTNLKRLPDELLENLSDLPQRPKKKRKISKKEEKIVPSRFMFSPGESSDNKSLKIEDYVAPVSTGGGTTHFSVVNLEKVKKQPKKAAAVASFRDIMLARNPRQPVSAFLMYKAKQKASGKQLSSRKRA